MTPLITLRRWWYVIATYRNYWRDLNRRACVEAELCDCAHGKRPLPDADQCADWARRLGVPDPWRRQ